MEVLLWARGRSLWEVRNFLGKVGLGFFDTKTVHIRVLGKTGNTKYGEIQLERRKSTVDDNLDIFKRRRSSIRLDTANMNFKSDEMSKKILKHDGNQIRKIRQMVNFDENSLALSATQKNMYGIIDEE